MWAVSRENWASWVYRHPMLLAAVVAVICLLLAAQSCLAGMVVALILGALGGCFLSRKVGMLWAITGILVVGVYQVRVEHALAAEQRLLARGEFDASGTLLEDARGSSRFWVAPVRLDAGVRVWWQGRGEVPVAGAKVGALGQAHALEGPRNPGEFDRELWLRRQGVVAEFHQGYREGRVDTPMMAALGSTVREEFRRRLTLGLDEGSERAQVIRAMVMGERPSAADDLIGAFRNSGTMHVFSVSGLHVAMVGSIGWMLMACCGVPRKWAVLGLVPLVFAYAWLTGANPPAMRAAWMASLFLGAFVCRRRPNLLNALGVVLWAGLLWDGRQLHQPGVQLSYGVVAVIALAHPISSKLFGWMAKPELYLPVQLMTPTQQWWLRMRQKIAQSLGVSFAAGMGSAPLTAIHFGLVTPISVIASVVLVPVVFLLLAVALFSVAISMVSPTAAKALNQCNGGLAVASIKIADGFAAVPGGHFRWGLDHQPRLIVYDLDYGDQALCFHGGRGEGTVMVDFGGRRSFQYQVAPSLKRLGLVPDSVVLTHPDGGHLGGGGQVAQELGIQQVLLPVRQARSRDYQEWLDLVGVSRLFAEEVDALPFPNDALLEILYVPTRDADNARADQRVVVSRLHWRGWKILLMSDAGMTTEKKLLEMEVDVSADVVVAGKNRTDLSLCDAFVDAVNPRVMVLTHSEFPVAEQRSARRMSHWREQGVEVFDQSQSGAVTMTIDEDGSLIVEGFANGQLLKLPIKH